MRCAPRLPARGFTLIEVLIVIVVIGVAAVALTQLSMRGSTMSSQMMRSQQARALATALLNEVESMPFTYCDPNDGAAGMANSPAGCAIPEAIGAEAGETRLGATPLDNVNDYNGTALAGGTLRDAANQLLGTNLPQLASCSATFVVRAVALGTITLASGDALQIQVTVNCPGVDAPAVVEGIRVRYAPNQYQY